ncbi:hypothetical protein CerSpe_098020 [Prunus speciosa]
MAGSEVALEVENPTMKTERSVIDQWESVTTKGKSAPKDKGNRSSRKWSTILKEIFDPQGRFYTIWIKIFIISCVFAVSLDPLFFYIPIVNEDMKCLILDKNLKAIALSFRSLTDRFYLVDIIFQILISLTTPKLPGDSAVTKKHKEAPVNGNKSVKDALAIANRICRSYILVDILAVLPIPQVVIFIFFSKTRGSRSLKTRKLLNSLLVLQYVPRVLRIFLLCHERHLVPRKTGIWVKGVFNFFLYILASHVLGALWYFFTIQRQTDCWQYACKSENGCELTTFDCDDHHTFRNITLLNELCPVNQPNTTLFDFGIFAAALQSGMLRSTDFPQKFLICFWWGLRNLSSLGQNLQTSTYVWENLFAVLVSIIGLLLFLYLIGNLQTYLQFATTRSEKLRRKLKTKDLEIDLWLSRKGLPKNLKEVIMQVVQQKLEQNKDVQVENILSVLPLVHSNFIRRYLRLATLKNVRILKAMDEKLLKAICEHLVPINYNENKDIIGDGDQLDRMLFIRQGIVRAYRTNGKGGKIGTSKLLEKGDLYGEELLHWASNQITSHTVLPISTRNVKSVSKVEAFTLTARDLELVITKFWWYFTKDKELNQFSEPQLKQLKKHAISSIEKRVHRINQAKMNKQQHTPPLAGECSSGSITWRQRVNVSKLRDQVSSPRSPLGAPC